MSNKVIALIVAVVLAAGISGFLLFGSDDDSDDANTDNNNDTTEVTNDNGDFDGDNPFGLDFASLDESVRLTISTPEGTGTLEIDGTNSRTVFSDGTTESEIISVDNTTYVFDPASGQWFSYTTTVDAAPISIDTALSKDDINDFVRSDITNLGNGPCAAGTCRIFLIADNDGNETTVRIDSSNRLSEVETSVGGETSLITYEYTDITITAPEGAVQFGL